MNKAELVETIFEGGWTGETRAEAERAVAAVLGAIARGLKRDRRVQISGFGVFLVRKRRARVGTNPRTGRPIAIAARRTVAFRAGERLKSDLGQEQVSAASLPGQEPG